jgi:hypothetical protein
MDEKYPEPVNQAVQPMTMCESPRKRDPERNKRLLGVAESIAAIVEAQVHRRDRCKLRQMVEMLLDD